MTRAAFENAITIVMALGGSTNAVLHLLAMAHSVGVGLTIDDFQKISDRTPFIADLKPSGKYVMEDIHKIGKLIECVNTIISTSTVALKPCDCGRWSYTCVVEYRLARRHASSTQVFAR